ncbi:MAG: protein kinase [Prosthecobacter sp.]|uniref:serine/threonine-protein kinase n=1 Tax=Prosthecobacter sp. TaxID=1965333 RepID=UPI001A104692|nr:serine/threonine-protein kinase [Prosthecobacter sp.]MBE2282858.1 protein kinase [Prosthecobacter sp.]
MKLPCPHCSHLLTLDDTRLEAYAPGFDCPQCGDRVEPELATEPEDSAPTLHSPTGQCPQCGATLPPGMAPSQCPRCLLGAGMAESEGSVLQPGGEFDSRYRIERLIGKGGMGAVYSALDARLGRKVAVKVLPEHIADHPEAAARFEREARAMAALQHPNIVQVHDFGVTLDGGHYLVMELVDGMNLHQLRQSRQLTLHGTLQIISQVCQALHYAHSRGIVHRDIKPANILVTREGVVKVADFGLAKMLGTETRTSAAAERTLTKSGTVMGTPDYMAPEQIEGRRVDHRADIYALGVMLYDLLTGTPPRGAWSPPSDLLEVDHRLDEIILRALRLDPQDRYQSALEVQQDVDSVSTSTGGQPLPPGPAAPLPSTGSRPAAVAPARRATTVKAAVVLADSAAEQEEDDEDGYDPAVEAMLRTTRSLNSTMLILGLLAIGLIGGLAVFLAMRKTGDVHNISQTITTTVTNNSYFTQLIASGVTSLDDLAALEIRPLGDAFVGITRSSQTWTQASELAKRTGSEVLTVDTAQTSEMEQLEAWLSSDSKASAALWVRQGIEPALYAAKSVKPSASPDAQHPALLVWKPEKVLSASKNTETTAQPPPPAPPSPTPSAPPPVSSSPSLPASMSPSPQVSPTPSSWTDTTGRTIQATFLRLEGESVIVRMDGKEFTIPFTRLSPPSIEQAKRLGAAAK